MDLDPQDPPSWPAPGPQEPGPQEPAPKRTRAASRDRSLRQVRRLSNWTAVGLVAVTAVTASYFARAHPGTQQPASVSGSQSHAPGASSGRPCVSVPVAVSGGSGVAVPAPAPAQSCAPGTSGTQPPVTYLQPSGDGRDYGGD